MTFIAAILFIDASFFCLGAIFSDEIKTRLGYFAALLLHGIAFFDIVLGVK